jgi:hypothetical protein
VPLRYVFFIYKTRRSEKMNPQCSLGF